MNAMQELCAKKITKHQALLREVKQDLHKWRDIPCPWTGRLNLLEGKSSYMDLSI